MSIHYEILATDKIWRQTVPPKTVPGNKITEIRYRRNAFPGPTWRNQLSKNIQTPTFSRPLKSSLKSWGATWLSTSLMAGKVRVWLGSGPRIFSEMVPFMIGYMSSFSLVISVCLSVCYLRLFIDLSFIFVCL